MTFGILFFSFFFYDNKNDNSLKFGTLNRKISEFDHNNFYFSSVLHPKTQKTHYFSIFLNFEQKNFNLF